MQSQKWGKPNPGGYIIRAWEKLSGMWYIWVHGTGMGT